MTAEIADLYAQVDKSISDFVFDGLSRVGYDVRGKGNPVTLQLPLVASPTPLVLALAAYFLMVTMGLLIVKPKAVGDKKQDPLWLRILVQVRLFPPLLSSH